MELVSSKTLIDKYGYSWRILSDGQNSVWQRSVPVPSNSYSNFQFATFTGSIPPEVIRQSLELSESDFSSAEEQQSVEVEFIFKSGMTTCELPCLDTLAMAGIKDVLNDIKFAWEDIDKLSYLECSLVLSVYNQVEKVLNEKHKICKPFSIAFKSQSEKLDWYLDAIA